MLLSSQAICLLKQKIKLQYWNHFDINANVGEDVELEQITYYSSLFLLEERTCTLRSFQHQS